MLNRRESRRKKPVIKKRKGYRGNKKINKDRRKRRTLAKLKKNGAVIL